MLVLTRKLNETIVIDGTIRVTLLEVRRNQVRLGIEAPDRVGILRKELCNRSGRDGQSGADARTNRASDTGANRTAPITLRACTRRDWKIIEE
jgi:carbon storage regulator